MVDVVRLLRLMRSVTDDVAVLRAESTAAPERRSDPMWMRGVKYTFVTVIEACIDAAQHVCATGGFGPPSSNSDAMRVLADHGVIDDELGDVMRQVVGFRNVLVHDYVPEDDEIVATRLDDLSALEAFVDALARLARE